MLGDVARERHLRTTSVNGTDRSTQADPHSMGSMCRPLPAVPRRRSCAYHVRKANPIVCIQRTCTRSCAYDVHEPQVSAPYIYAPCTQSTRMNNATPIQPRHPEASTTYDHGSGLPRHATQQKRHRPTQTNRLVSAKHACLGAYFAVVCTTKSYTCQQGFQTRNPRSLQFRHYTTLTAQRKTPSLHRFPAGGTHNCKIQLKTTHIPTCINEPRPMGNQPAKHRPKSRSSARARLHTLPCTLMWTGREPSN